MKKVYIVIILTIVLILIICGIEFFTNNRHEEEQNMTTANENAVVNEATENYATNSNVNQIDEDSRNINNVTMKIKEGTLTKTSATILIEDKNEEKYDYGQWFRIDKKENGEWKELEQINENFAFTDIAYIPKEDGTIEIEENWKDLYGELDTGEYRLVKELYGNEKNYIYAEFTIE